ncbi:winged helix DNA-binding protein [Enterococcus faecium]|nr:winged helix DNA-binding protein [Enterococcus faecium]
MDGSNVTRTIQKLTKMGLVTKKSTQDRRSFLLELTKKRTRTSRSSSRICRKCSEEISIKIDS